MDGSTNMSTPSPHPIHPQIITPHTLHLSINYMGLSQPPPFSPIPLSSPLPSSPLLPLWLILGSCPKRPEGSFILFNFPFRPFPPPSPTLSHFFFFKYQTFFHMIFAFRLRAASSNHRRSFPKQSREVLQVLKKKGKKSTERQGNTYSIYTYAERENYICWHVKNKMFNR